LHVRKSLSEEAKNARKQSVGKGWDKSNREGYTLATRDPARGFRKIVRILKQPSAPFEKAPAGRGQFDFMAVSLKELNSNIFFQQANLRAERRLGQMKTFGGTPEIEFFGNSDEVPRMTEFHREETAIAITYRSDRNKVIPISGGRAFIETLSQTAGHPHEDYIALKGEPVNV